MRLILDPDPAWAVRDLGAQRFAVLGENIVLAWGALVAYPHQDVAGWQRRALAVELPPDGGIEVRATERLVTRTGWRADVVDAVVTAGTMREHRLGAFFRFLEHGAVALVRAHDAAALERVRSSVLAVLATARPDWTAGAPTCLHDCLAC